MKSVAITEAGSILGVGMNNKLYSRDHIDANWIKSPNDHGEVQSIAIMSNGTTILGVGMDHKLYTRTDINASWVKAPDRGGMVKSVAVTEDDVSIGVGMDNKLYTRENLYASWVKAPDYGQVTDITILKNGAILGIGEQRIFLPFFIIPIRPFGFATS